MTDKERLDHAIVVFTLLNEKLLADLCIAIKKHSIRFSIDGNKLNAQEDTRLTIIIQKSLDRKKAEKVYYSDDPYSRMYNRISFELTHNPE